MKTKILILLLIIVTSIVPMIVTAQLAESEHPYANNFVYTWPAITEPGASQMRLHFIKLELANCDGLKILDASGNKLTEYGGCYGTYLKEDFWTEWFTTDTMTVRLTSVGGNAYGVLVDQKQTRQTVVPTSTYLAESYHPYANNFVYTWPVITEPGASQMRLHFIKLELANCDGLKILDASGNKLTEYGGCYGTYLKEDFWTEWFTTDTMTVRLTSVGGTAYGFLIDSKETKAGTPTPIPTYTPALTPTYTTPYPTPTSIQMSNNNIALGKPILVTTNGVDKRECSGQMPIYAITDGNLDYKSTDSCSRGGVVGYVNDDYNQLMTVNVNIDLQGTYRINKIRYNMGNVQNADKWNADIMESPFGRVPTNQGSANSGTWTEQTGDLVTSKVNIMFEKTRTVYENDWLFIGEIEVYGTPLSTIATAPTYASQIPNVPDTSPPSISLGKPQIVDFNKNGQLEEGEKLEITFGADDESGVKSIKVLVDGNQIDLRNSQGTYSVITDSLVMGDHSIQVEAIDSKGNKKTEKMTINAARLGPSVYFPTSRYEVMEGDDFNVVLSAVNPIGNPMMEALLILKPPGNGVSTYDSDCKGGYSGQCTGKFEIESGESVRSITVRMKAERSGEYPIDAEVYYQFEDGQRSPTRYETLTLVVKPKETPIPISAQVTESPGFSIEFSIIAVLLIAIYIRKRI